MSDSFLETEPSYSTPRDYSLKPRSAFTIAAICGVADGRLTKTLIRASRGVVLNLIHSSKRPRMC